MMGVAYWATCCKGNEPTIKNIEWMASDGAVASAGWVATWLCQAKPEVELSVCS